MPRPRITIGAAFVVIAASALAFNAFRTVSEEGAIEIATAEFLRSLPGSSRARTHVKSKGWDAKKKVWVITLQHRLCFTILSVDRSGRCRGNFLFRG